MCNWGMHQTFELSSKHCDFTVVAFLLSTNFPSTFMNACHIVEVNKQQNNTIDMEVWHRKRRAHCMTRDWKKNMKKTWIGASSEYLPTLSSLTTMQKKYGPLSTFATSSPTLHHHNTCLVLFLSFSTLTSSNNIV